ncbi:MAG: efflux RND transporter periplasmic adaptor subunit [Rhodospirillaceae bacterium]|nr:efflux RND transporter periplasmic adaptor subunit [Rhodospirillaceae bacterium]
MSRSLFIALACAVGAAVWILSGQFGDSAPEADGEAAVASGGAATEAAGESEQIIRTVRVRPSAAEPFEDLLVLYGRTAAERTVDVRAQIDGQVVEVSAERGDVVAAGQVLVRLSTDERAARVAQGEALVAQREAEHQAAARLNQSGYRSATDLAAAQAALDAARADLELARLQLGRLEITAPFDGRLDQRPVELGDFVDIGQTVATVVDLDPVRVVGQVSERHLGEINMGEVANVQLLDGRVEQGVVSYVGATADEVTRTFPVEVEIANPDGTLISGVTAEISVPIARVMAHRISPGILTLDDNGVIGLRAVDAEGTVVFFPVEIAGGSSDAVWVTGLPDTADVIVVGQDFVIAGQHVNAVEGADPAAADLEDVAPEGAEAEGS